MANHHIPSHGNLLICIRQANNLWKDKIHLNVYGLALEKIKVCIITEKLNIIILLKLMAIMKQTLFQLIKRPKEQKQLRRLRSVGMLCPFSSSIWCFDRSNNYTCGQRPPNSSSGNSFKCNAGPFFNPRKHRLNFVRGQMPTNLWYIMSVTSCSKSSL